MHVHYMCMPMYMCYACACTQFIDLWDNEQLVSSVTFHRDAMDGEKITEETATRAAT